LKHDFLFRSSLKVASSIIFDTSHYLFRRGRYHPNIRSKDVPVDRILIWQKIVDGVTYNDAEFLKFFRILRDMLVDLVKDHPVFQIDGK
jgi:hypothetical protein